MESTPDKENNHSNASNQPARLPGTLSVSLFMDFASAMRGIIPDKRPARKPTRAS
ncbi:MAG: hypothetical protein IKV13_02405 [Akkermansia sp.]|nr:hypothetical protein [Akkermansia sp.]